MLLRCDVCASYAPGDVPDGPNRNHESVTWVQYAAEAAEAVRVLTPRPPKEGNARSGRLEDARLVFEKMHTYANHLGLYSEEISATGEQLGNFPQAFSHLSLISAAVNLDRQLDHRPG